MSDLSCSKFCVVLQHDLACYSAVGTLRQNMMSMQQISTRHSKSPSIAPKSWEKINNCIQHGRIKYVAPHENICSRGLEIVLEMTRMFAAKLAWVCSIWKTLVQHPKSGETNIVVEHRLRRIRLIGASSTSDPVSPHPLPLDPCLLELDTKVVPQFWAPQHPWM